MMKIPNDKIVEYARRYDQNASGYDKSVEQKIKQVLQTRRYLNRQELIEVGIWKSPRQKKNYGKNDDGAVRELTQFSFTARSEQARVGALLALRGVSYPVASTLLHFAFPDEYPILDTRALWSLGWETPSSYTFEFWRRYCAHLIKLSTELNLDLRTIDKALWQYSKENQ